MTANRSSFAAGSVQGRPAIGDWKLKERARQATTAASGAIRKPARSRSCP